MQAAVHLHTRPFLIGHCAQRSKIFGGWHDHALIKLKIKDLHFQHFINCPLLKY
jgi:hypothetical protein